jgi:hypothetical protein
VDREALFQAAHLLAPMRRGSIPSPHATRAAWLAELENLRLGHAGPNKLALSACLLNIKKALSFLRRLTIQGIQEKEK